MRVPLTARVTPALRDAIVCPHGDVLIQCRYHYGEPTNDCVIVQLSHKPRDKTSWQEPIPVCKPCRDYLGRSWRYWKGT